MYSVVRYVAFKLLPKTTIMFEFRRHAGYWPNLRNPRSFNEKIQWLKLYWYNPKATICADKFLVRGYVEKCGLGHILNDLYGVYDNTDEIELENLPNEFVMKVTHGCGQNLICNAKTKIDWGVEKNKFRKWLKTSHYYDSLEWVYKDIKPRIVVEKLIKTSDGKPPKDYKVFCFNGEPKCLFVASDRGEGTTKFDFFDLDWNHIPVKNHYPNSEVNIVKPKELDEILEYSRILSSGFPHVRIDFYIEQNKVIFGECTFFHFSGSEPFKPLDYDFKMGEFLDFQEISKCKKHIK